MEGFVVTLIEGNAKLVAFLIFFFSILGVLWHVLLTRRMSFVNFGKDEDENARKAKEMLRLFLPMGVVIVMGIILPYLFVALSPELKDSLIEPETTQYVKFPWSWLLPARGWVNTIIFNAIFSGILYWVIGGIFYFISRLIISRRVGR
ncbi:hypothetical protein HY990_00060 [Candidatus Micrarchaeota archaeon]|nr:hypothetical protein [Candidatus Micrarchaeota archaeon]